MIKRTITILSILLLLTSLTSNVYADAICKDGWRSKSSGSGTCSWHGGVLNWLPKAGPSSSYSRDVYYDSSDNGSGGSGLCTHKDRRNGETLKGCSNRKSNDIRERFLNQYRIKHVYPTLEYNPTMQYPVIDFSEQTSEPFFKGSEFQYNPFSK